MLNLRLVKRVVLGGCLCTCVWSCGCGSPENQQTPKSMPAQIVRRASFRVVFDDGREANILDSKVMQQSNPGYIPAQYAPVEKLEFRKWTTSLGATTEEKKDIAVSDIRAIEYTKNNLNWCITLLYLSNGGCLGFEDGKNFDKNGPKSVLNRLPKGFFDRFPTEFFRSDFKDYSPPRSGSEKFGTYHLRGRIENATFEDNAGDLFSCPHVEDKGYFLAIKKVEFNWGR
jgi:hypothetical protein